MLEKRNVVSRLVQQLYAILGTVGDLKEKNATFLITPLMPFSTPVLEKLGDFPLRISVTRQQLFQKYLWV